MKTKQISALLTAALLSILFCGCFFGRNDFVQPVDYDLILTGKAAAASLPVEFGAFRNISGADRRMAVRRGGNRIESDEYHRWLLPPEVMLQRLLAAAMPQNASSTSSDDVADVDCVLRRFDFDADRKKAVIAADFQIKYQGRTIHKSILKETSWEGAGIDSRAKAMNRAAVEMASEVSAIVAGLPERRK